MKRRTKVPRGYSACRIFLIDLGPQLSRQLLRCILVHCPICIQQGLHQASRIPSRNIHGHPTNSNAVTLDPILEYSDHHRYSITHAKEKTSFPIEIAAQYAHNFQLFNWNLLQLNTCLYRQSLCLSLSPSPFLVAVMSWSQALQYMREHTHMLSLVVVLSLLF